VRGRKPYHSFAPCRSKNREIFNRRTIQIKRSTSC
jgi:hypothetical protein